MQNNSSGERGSDTSRSSFLHQCGGRSVTNRPITTSTDFSGVSGHGDNGPSIVTMLSQTHQPQQVGSVLPDLFEDIFEPYPGSYIPRVQQPLERGRSGSSSLSNTSELSTSSSQQRSKLLCCLSGKPPNNGLSERTSTSNKCMNFFCCGRCKKCAGCCDDDDYGDSKQHPLNLHAHNGGRSSETQPISVSPCRRGPDTSSSRIVRGFRSYNSASHINHHIRKEVEFSHKPMDRPLNSSTSVIPKNRHQRSLSTYSNASTASFTSVSSIKSHKAQNNHKSGIKNIRSKTQDPGIILQNTRRRMQGYWHES